MNIKKLIPIIIVILSFIIAISLYSKMPDKMASHWGTKGEVNGYLSKFWGLFLMPFISVGLILLFMFIPKMDPLKSNIDKFRKYYDTFIIFMISFFFYIYMLTLAWNLGFTFNMIYFLTPAFTVLFYYCGTLIENAKRNWFIGIRTPWTLSSDIVWDKTHSLGGKLFKIMAIGFLVLMFIPNYFFWLFILLVLGVTLFLFIYSYVIYSKDVRKKEAKK